MDVELSGTGLGERPLPLDCTSSSGMFGAVISLVVHQSEDPAGRRAGIYYPGMGSGLAVYPWPIITTPRATAAPAHVANRGLSAFRKQEMDWLEAHKSEFKNYENCWLAIDGDRLVAYGPKLSEVCAEAKRKGVNNPLTVFVPPEEKGISIGF